MADIAQVAQFALGETHRDQAWRCFGYSKRPRYGTMVNKYFRADWKVDLEIEITAHLFCMSAAAALLSMNACTRAGEVIFMVLNASGYGMQLVETFGYENPRDASTELEELIRYYCELPANEWPDTFKGDVEELEIPVKRKEERAALGATIYVEELISRFGIRSS